MPKDNYLPRYKSPNIVIIPAPPCYPPSPKRQKAENEMDNYLPRYKSPNIVIIPAPPCYPPSPKRQKAENEMDNYLSRYKSPNTVIIPAPPCYPPSPKKQKEENEMQSLSPQHVDLSFLDDFNIDEIVECLNNCDNNDNTAQDNSGVNHTPDELIKVSENRLNTNDNDQKFDTIELESTKKSDNTLNNEENEIQNELITNILYNNNSERITETNTLRGDNFNTQSASTAVENTVKNTTCTEAKIIEKDTEQDSTDHTKPFNTQSDSTAVENTFKNTTCTEAKIIEKYTEQDSADHIKPLHNVNKNEHIVINSKDCQLTNKPNITKIDNTNESQDNIINLNPKNTTYIVNPVVDIKSKVLNEDKELMKERTKSTKSLKSVVSKANNNLYQKLENRMFDYLHKKYSVESVIHYGRFSKILKCKDSSGKQYAIKMLNKQSDWFFLGINKDKMLMSLQAEIPKENLFLVYCSKSFSFNRYWCFLMDFYPKNLKQALEESPKPFHIDLVQELARQLVAAVTLLRNNNVVHSDIKPSHILLNSSQNCLKLCGFDSAYYIEEASIKPNIGSVNYRPPEVILGYSAGFSVDVWCTALVLYEMITGTQLFPGDSNLNILNKQICEFGNIPPDMLSNSHYTSRYFIGGIFRKRLYFKETAVFTNNFNKNKKLYKTVYAAYYDNWESSRTKIQKLNDFKKIKSLLKLLVKMLTIHPKYRITIEFVYANPFVYEMYDC